MNKFFVMIATMVGMAFSNSVAASDQPNLVVTGPVLFSSSTIPPGETLRVFWTEKNQGTSPTTSAHRTKVYLASTAYGTTRQIGYFGPMSTLDIGESRLYHGDTTVPSTTPAGEYYVTVLIDSDGQITESDEGDNIASSSPAKVTVSGTRIITLSGDLAFGNQVIGTAAQRTMTISNNGIETLTVNSISYPNGYSGNWSSGTIAAGGSQEVTIIFSPQEAISYSGLVTVNSDRTSGLNTRSVSGTGVQPPAVETPTISPYGGTFPGSVEVTLACATAEATIYYTTDGSDPTQSSLRYERSFTLMNSATVKAAAFKSAFRPSEVASAPFTITSTPTRTIFLSGSLEFGEVPVGSSQARTLTISNYGNAPLSVSGIICPPNFSAEWTGSIPPGEAKSVSVNFSPDAAHSYEGTLIVQSDKTAGDNTLQVSGNGIFCAATLNSPGPGEMVSIGPTFTWIFNGNCGNTVYLATNSSAEHFVVLSNILTSGTNSITLTPAQWSGVLASLGYAETFYWTVGNADATAGDIFADWQPFTVPACTALQIISFPADLTVAKGQSAVLNVTATSCNPVTYQWRFNGRDIVGATFPEITISTATSRQSGSYSVVVSDGIDTVISETSVMRVVNGVKIRGPKDRNVRRGAKAAFTVNVTGTRPLSFQWFFNGAPIEGAIARRLVLIGVDFAQEGRYFVQVTGPAGSVYSREATLTLR